MINPYNPAPLPRLNTAPQPTVADHFTNMLQPIIQMQQLNQQRAMQEQTMAMNQQRMQAMEMEMARGERRDQREIKQEDIEDQMSDWLMQRIETGQRPAPSDIAAEYTRLGAKPDQILAWQKEGRQETMDTLNVFKQMPTAEGAPIMSAMLKGNFDYDIEPEELYRALTEKRSQITTNDGRILSIKETKDGQIEIVDEVDTLPEGQRAVNAQTQALNMRKLQLSVQKAELELSVTNLKLQDALQPPQVGGEIDQKTVQKQVDDFVGDTQAMIRAFDQNMIAVQMQPEERKQLLDSLYSTIERHRQSMVKVIEDSDIPESLKQNYLARIRATASGGNRFRSALEGMRGQTPPPPAEQQPSFLGALGRDLMTRPRRPMPIQNELGRLSAGQPTPPQPNQSVEYQNAAARRWVQGL